MIMALDLSTKSTGWCIFDNLKLKDYGCITASSSDVIKRIQKVTKEIQNIFQKYPDIEKIVVEEVRPDNDQIGVRNLHTHKILMYLQASIIFMLHDSYPKVIIEYTYPSEWRKACGIRTGRGVRRDSLKAADIEFVKTEYKINVNDDIADAIGIGHAYVNQLNNEINWE